MGYLMERRWMNRPDLRLQRKLLAWLLGPLLALLVLDTAVTYWIVAALLQPRL
jgi:hypothetical protein